MSEDRLKLLFNEMMKVNVKCNDEFKEAVETDNIELKKK